MDTDEVKVNIMAKMEMEKWNEWS